MDLTAALEQSEDKELDALIDSGMSPADKRRFLAPEPEPAVPAPAPVEPAPVAPVAVEPPALPTAEPILAAPAEPAPVAPTTPALAPDFEARITALEASTRSANGRAAREARRAEELELQNQVLTRQLAAQQQNAPSAPTPSAPAATGRLLDEAGLTDDDRAIGDDILNPMEKVAQAAVKRALAAQPAPALQDTETREQLRQIREREYWRDLSASVPDFRQFTKGSESDDFLGRLVEIEPITGRPWGDLLHEAESRLDAQRVAAILSRLRPAGGVPAPPPPAPAPKTPLAAQVMPPMGSPTPIPPVPAKTIYTAEQFKRLQGQLSAGMFSDEESMRLDAELDAAVNEGRIKN